MPPPDRPNSPGELSRRESAFVEDADRSNRTLAADVANAFGNTLSGYAHRVAEHEVEDRAADRERLRAGPFDFSALDQWRNPGAALQGVPAWFDHYIRPHLERFADSIPVNSPQVEAYYGGPMMDEIEVRVPRLSTERARQDTQAEFQRPPVLQTIIQNMLAAEAQGAPQMDARSVGALTEGAQTAGRVGEELWRGPARRQEEHMREADRLREIARVTGDPNAEALANREQAAAAASFIEYLLLFAAPEQALPGAAGRMAAATGNTGRALQSAVRGAVPDVGVVRGSLPEARRIVEGLEPQPPARDFAPIETFRQPNPTGPKLVDRELYEAQLADGRYGGPEELQRFWTQLGWDGAVTGEGILRWNPSANWEGRTGRLLNARGQFLDIELPRVDMREQGPMASQTQARPPSVNRSQLNAGFGGGDDGGEPIINAVLRRLGLLKGARVAREGEQTFLVPSGFDGRQKTYATGERSTHLPQGMVIPNEGIVPSNQPFDDTMMRDIAAQQRPPTPYDHALAAQKGAQAGPQLTQRPGEWEDFFRERFGRDPTPEEAANDMEWLRFNMEAARRQIEEAAPPAPEPPPVPPSDQARSRWGVDKPILPGGRLTSGVNPGGDDTGEPLLNALMRRLGLGRKREETPGPAGAPNDTATPLDLSEPARAARAQRRISEVRTPRGEMHETIVNPTEADILRLTRPGRVSQGSAVERGVPISSSRGVRYIRDAEGNVYVGNSYDVTHHDLVTHYGLPNRGFLDGGEIVRLPDGKLELQNNDGAMLLPRGWLRGADAQSSPSLDLSEPAFAPGTENSSDLLAAGVPIRGNDDGKPLLNELVENVRDALAPRRRNRAPSAEMARAIDLAGERRSLSEISRETGVAVESLRQYFRRNNIDFERAQPGASARSANEARDARIAELFAAGTNAKRIQSTLRAEGFGDVPVPTIYSAAASRGAVSPAGPGNYNRWRGPTDQTRAQANHAIEEARRLSEGAAAPRGSALRAAVGNAIGVSPELVKRYFALARSGSLGSDAQDFINTVMRAAPSRAAEEVAPPTVVSPPIRNPNIARAVEWYQQNAGKSLADAARAVKAETGASVDLGALSRALNRAGVREPGAVGRTHTYDYTRLRELSEEGATSAEASRELGIPQPTLLREAERQGIEFVPNPPPNVKQARNDRVLQEVRDRQGGVVGSNRGAGGRGHLENSYATIAAELNADRAFVLEHGRITASTISGIVSRARASGALDALAPRDSTGAPAAPSSPAAPGEAATRFGLSPEKIARLSARRQSDSTMAGIDPTGQPVFEVRDAPGLRDVVTRAAALVREGVTDEDMIAKLVQQTGRARYEIERMLGRTNILTPEHMARIAARPHGEGARGIRPVTPEEAERLQDMVQRRGLSHREAAQESGRGTATVRRHTRRSGAGIPDWLASGGYFTALATAAEGARRALDGNEPTRAEAGTQ